MLFIIFGNSCHVPPFPSLPLSPDSPPSPKLPSPALSASGTPSYHSLPTPLTSLDLCRQYIHTQGQHKKKQIYFSFIAIVVVIIKYSPHGLLI